ncbi:hypothetical protein SS50377_22922 [Spironucleus salmonicida]|uniref:Uncharacterized protein n=1 Tax=Spironucleus salmonicida TaxID=348837 RepID=V6LVW2_9EUKA|nr:hypothetical protein SS50377_22922 [Spironucleus salmonicida]|eukprot:EST48767.1 Hypothetical protein SS50377_11091 [Spironucleus salmonicida]
MGRSHHRDTKIKKSSVFKKNGVDNNTDKSRKKQKRIQDPEKFRTVDQLTKKFDAQIQALEVVMEAEKAIKNSKKLKLVIQQIQQLELVKSQKLRLARDKEWQKTQQIQK